MVAIAAIGIPVAVSVKYRDGEVRAAELREAFGVLAWKIDITSPRRFSSVQARLFWTPLETETQTEDDALPESFLTFDHSMERSVKSAEVGIFLDESSAQIRMGSLFAKGDHAVEIDSPSFRPENLGGKGKQLDSNLFLLGKDIATQRRLLARIETGR